MLSNQAPPVQTSLRQFTTDLRYPVGIAGSGTALPDQVIDNNYWTQRLPTTDDWIVAKTGISERRWAPEGQRLSDLCVLAANQALERAGVTPAEVDAIIVNTVTPDFRLPSTALIIKEAIGAARALPLDLDQVACAGVTYGVFVGMHLLQNPALRCVLVIGGDLMSRLINPSDRGSAVFFGDGAGALVLRRTRDRDLGILSWDLGSALSMDVCIPHGGSARPLSTESIDEGKHLLHMNGKTVWREATRVLPETVRRSVAKAGLPLNKIKLLLFHQANYNIVQEVMSQLGIPEDQTYCTIQRYGNTASGSLPIVYHEALTAGRMESGDLVTLAGVGAGFLWGSMLLRYSSDVRDFD